MLRKADPNARPQRESLSVESGVIGPPRKRVFTWISHALKTPYWVSSGVNEVAILVVKNQGAVNIPLLSRMGTGTLGRTQTRLRWAFDRGLNEVEQGRGHDRVALNAAEGRVRD